MFLSRVGDLSHVTTEVLIMNPHAIALASDSAVSTLGHGYNKIFPSANKLFALSKFEPVGIMIYGNSYLMELPWETIVKEFRRKLWDRSFDTLKGYADEFMAYLESGDIHFSSTYQDHYVEDTIQDYFRYINEHIKKKVHQQFEIQASSEKNVPITLIKKIVKDVIDDHYNSWKDTENICSVGADFNNELLLKYKDLIDRLIKEVFGKLPLTKRQKEKLKIIAGDLFSKFPEGIDNAGTSGLVIAGFGKCEYLPSYVSIQTECYIANKIKYIVKEYVKVDPEENIRSLTTAFAQDETIHAFIHGIDPNYKIYQESYLINLFEEYSKLLVETVFSGTETEKSEFKKEVDSISKEILKTYQSELQEFRQRYYTGPIADVVTILPKSELAEMAESLVNLASFKKKVSMVDETVGGPIDVAVISKDDGFIWIKRKHYFKSELNLRFFENYFRKPDGVE